MLAEQSTQSMTAVATIIAALIAAAISFVNLTLNKEQKTSEFRQAWIDGLRQDLASFFACVRAFTRATQELQILGEAENVCSPLTMTKEKVSEIRYQVAETHYRIQLRLNPKEHDHQELLRQMQVAIESMQSIISGTGVASNSLEALERVAAFAPQILKSEWERVKRGEFAFRFARNWVAPIVFFISFFFMFLVLLGQFVKEARMCTLLIALSVLIGICVLWVIPIALGIKACHRKNLSANWMWFGVHPITGWIAFAIIHSLPVFKECSQCTKKVKAHAKICPYCRSPFEV